MPEANNPKFSETEVTFLLYENCGWGDINRFPSAVYVEHECDREHPYEEAGHTFYDRTYLRYVPERTCRMSYTLGSSDDQKIDELDELAEAIFSTPEDTAGYICNSCGFEFRYDRGIYPNYCPNCGARVVE